MGLINTNISLRLIAELTGSALDFSVTPHAPLDYSKAIPLGNGTGLNQADKIWFDQRTLTTGANEDLDFAGALTDALGVTLTLAKLKALIIAAATTNTTLLTVTRPASNGVPFLAAASDGFALHPGGLFVLANPALAGYTVTAGTGDLINIANAAGASAVYDVIAIGTSA